MLSNKRDVSRLWQLGAFGNKLRTWSHPKEVLAEDVLNQQARWSLRSYVAGGKFQPNLTWSDLLQRWTPQYYICEPAPDEDRIVQGEVWRDVGGLYLVCSTEPVTMREALSRQDGTVYHHFGYDVQLYLQSVMSPESWIELQDCLDLHEDVVIEFTVFNRCVGDRVGRNTIIWECRCDY